MSIDPRHDDISPDEPEPCAACGLYDGFTAETRDGVPGLRCAACGVWTAYDLDEPECSPRPAGRAWEE